MFGLQVGIATQASSLGIHSDQRVARWLANDLVEVELGKNDCTVACFSQDKSQIGKRARSLSDEIRRGHEGNGHQSQRAALGVEGCPVHASRSSCAVLRKASSDYAQTFATKALGPST